MPAAINGHLELGPIRPPSEAQSLLLRVTRNCPWNHCEFCHTYKGERFSFRTVEAIKQDIDRVKDIYEQIRNSSWALGYGGEITREVLGQIHRQSARYDHGWQNVIGWLYSGGTQVFLQDANSVMVKTQDLVEILKYLKTQFPFINRITSYGRARTLAKKTVEELKELREAGLTRIHIGMETGYDPLLELMKKGVTAKEQVQAGRNVVASGISLCEYVMPGLGGTRWWREHAVETAKVLNQINPGFIRFRTLYVRQDMPLYKRVAKGEFERPPDDDIVREIRLFIETLEGIQSTLVSDHILNLLEEIQGKLPEEKESMLLIIDRYLALPDEARLRYRVGRRLGQYRRLEDLEDSALGRRIQKMIDEIRFSQSPTPRPEGEIEKEIYSLMESYI
jgi:radical SAM superfamily enzyme YgiQ (UPF0313 family)